MTTEGWTTDDDLKMGEASTEPPKPVEPGIYQLKLVSYEAKKTQANGHPSLRMQLAIESAFDGHDISKNSKKISTTVVFTADAAWNAKSLGAAAGVEPPTTSGYDAVCGFGDALMGQLVWATLKMGQVSQKTAKRYLEVGYWLTEEQAAKEAQGDQTATGSGATETEAAPAKRRTRKAG